MEDGHEFDGDYGSFVKFKNAPSSQRIGRTRPSTPQVQELRTATPSLIRNFQKGTPLPHPEDQDSKIEETPLLSSHIKKYGAEEGGSNSSESCDSTGTFESADIAMMSRKITWVDIGRHVKTAIIFILVVLFSIIIAVTPDADAKEEYYSISKDSGKMRLNFSGCTKPELRLTVTGALEQRSPRKGFDNLTFVAAENNMSRSYSFALQPDYYLGDLVSKTVIFDLSQLKRSIAIIATSTSSQPFPFSLSYICHPLQITQQAIYAACVLAFVYVLIIFELVHRALAAMLGTLAALAVLSFLNERPDYHTLIGWIDFETLTLLFGMMILVAIFCETGFFDWAAFQAYKKAKGNVWVLITLLCVFAAVVSAFLDNVTTMLLMTPVTIRLCEVLNLDPRNVLIAEVIFSNIGGAGTAVGDPPNVIIVSNQDAKRKGVDFNTFTSHLAIGVVIVFFGAYILLRFMFMNLSTLRNKEPKEIMELKHEVEIWKRASLRITVATREESMVKALLLQKVVQLENVLQRKKLQIKENVEKDFAEGVLEMEAKYRIRDKALLIKTGLILAIVIIVFFLSSFINQIHLSLGWVAVLGSIWLLVLSDHHDMESLLDKVEWATLIFFAALFMLMEALKEMGLMQVIGDQLAAWIEAVDAENRLAVAIILILWVSALASSFIDNIPFTTAMVPVLVQLGEDSKLNLPFLPLIWSLAFGTCLGGNGTLIGASANVVCAGIAEQHGYGFSFVKFFKVGFPMMLLTVLIAMCYLLVVHCTGIAWNYS